MALRLEGAAHRSGDWFVTCLQPSLLCACFDPGKPVLNYLPKICGSIPQPP